MELELGLALPCNHFPTNINRNGSAGFHEMMRRRRRRKDSLDDNFSEMKQKRSFAEAFEDSNEGVERKTLSLFVWNGQPNEEEDDNDDDCLGRKKRPSEACDKYFEEENQILGWPPINTWRRKQFHDQQGGWITNDRNNIVGGRNSMYVKVKMEGVAIGRKVDLSLYHSYQLLTHNLLQMFAKYQNCGSRFKILYQDREGEWMLAGNVPWKTFVETVQRIEIHKDEKGGKT